MLCVSRNDVSCADATFSNILARKGSLDIGLKFTSSDQTDKFAFLGFGSTIACLKKHGLTPEESDKLNSVITHGTILSKNISKKPKQQ